MAGKKPGPSKGHGGRPRTKNPKARKDGYERVTIGPKGKGKQVYAQRAKAGLGNVKGSKGKGKVVDHKNHNRGDNSSKNLRVTTKAGNNKNRGKHRYPR